MWTGVLTVVATTAALVLVLWLLLYGGVTVRFVRRHRTSPAAPAGPPIEALAADLARLRAATRRLSPGTSQVRRVATLAAYDDVLADACRALDLPDTLGPLAPGPDREAERMRVESLLEAAGLRFTSSR